MAQIRGNSGPIFLEVVDDLDVNYVINLSSVERLQELPDGRAQVFVSDKAMIGRGEVLYSVQNYMDLVEAFRLL